MTTVTASRLESKRTHRRLALAMLIGPPLGTALALALAWRDGSLSALAIWLFLAFYFASVIGVEIGFHRYMSHRSFKCAPPLRLILIIFGSIAGEGPVLFWAATHRRHHVLADKDGDPHGPPRPGLAGFWRAHAGWLLEAPSPDIAGTAQDLIRDRTTMFGHRLYFVWFAAGLALPALIGLAVAGGRGALDGLLWGGFVRVFVAHQATWSINSMCHLFGTRPFATRDSSHNLAVLALLTLGGSWHNNHHAFPASAVNDFTWWQFDPSAWLIRSAARLGLVWDVRQPAVRLRQGGTRS